MPFSVNLIKKLERVSPDLREILLSLLEEIERQKEETVTKKEFLEFARQTEKNFQKVWMAINELAVAQRNTEQKVTELIEAQKNAEVRISRLETAVTELTEAQKNAESRISRLETAVTELTEAQKRTEDELKSLIREHKTTREIVMGLANTVGYGLEDKIFPYISDFAKKEYNVEVDVLDRKNIVYPDGKYDEVNIYIEGRRNGKKIYIVGECKAQPGKKDIRGFVRRLKRIEEHLGENVGGFIVGYSYSPSVERYIRENYPEIRLFKSFEFELKYSKAQRKEN